MKLFKTLVLVMVAGLVAGCASKEPNHYYTLQQSTATASQASAAPAVSSFAISTQPVDLPELVDRPQIVLTDPSSAQVVPLNNSLWAAPLSAEIRGALAEQLTSRLAVLDVSASTVPETLPVWKVYVTVQRFESFYDQRAVLDASWQLVPMNMKGKATSLCRAEITVPVGVGMSALVVGHQQAIGALAGLISDQILGKPLASTDHIQLKGCTAS